MDEDVCALSVPPAVISTSADLAEEVVADKLIQSELPESESKSNEEERRLQVSTSFSKYVRRYLKFDVKSFKHSLILGVYKTVFSLHCYSQLLIYRNTGHNLSNMCCIRLIFSCF